MKLIGENRSTLRKTCPTATLSTTNPTWTDSGSNPGLRGERPATNGLSHGTAVSVTFSCRRIYFQVYLLSSAVRLHAVARGKH
jgi:hypothetical protein